MPSFDRKRRQRPCDANWEHWVFQVLSSRHLLLGDLSEVIISHLPLNPNPPGSPFSGLWDLLWLLVCAVHGSSRVQGNGLEISLQNSCRLLQQAHSGLSIPASNTPLPHPLYLPTVNSNKTMCLGEAALGCRTGFSSGTYKSDGTLHGALRLVNTDVGTTACGTWSRLCLHFIFLWALL